MRSRIERIIIFSLTWLMMACNNQNRSVLTNNSQEASGIGLQFSLSNIEPMAGQHYEGWAITSSGVLSTGRFNVDDEGQIVEVDASGEIQGILSDTSRYSMVLPSDVESVSKFVLTIEPDGDTDDGPSAIHYLDGEFSNGRAMATTEVPGAIGEDFTAAAGSYILATPTNGPSTHNQGIWYLDNDAPSLTLPDLEAEWAYEGWIVNTSTGEVVSTGVFSSASGEDSDGAGEGAGPNPGPSFPGQDFITPAKVLNDGNHMAVISVEPVPDFDPAPFTVKILSHRIEDNAAVLTSFSLDNINNQNDVYIEVTIN